MDREPLSPETDELRQGGLSGRVTGNLIFGLSLITFTLVGVRMFREGINGDNIFLLAGCILLSLICVGALVAINVKANRRKRENS